MNIWAVANQKGGVGKTTTTVSLGGLLAQFGRRVLLVDTDPHGSLSSYFGCNPELVVDSVYTIFQGGASTLSVLGAMHRTEIDGLHLLPASTALATLDRQLGVREGMGRLLAEGLAKIATRYEHVIIDCPPMLGILMVNALGAADQVLVPVQTEHLALNGLERMQHTLAMIERSTGAELPWLIVPTMYDPRTKAAEDALQMLRRSYGFRVWPHVVPENTRLRDAAREGIPICFYDANCPAALAYQALLEFLTRWQEMPWELAG